ncbi:MAG TPA: hypothetical protein VIF59_12625 [Methylomirabilota bacterium]|jgi:hypothetical protein
MRNRPQQTQLEWRSPDEVRWEDLPPEVRDRAREWLAELLRQAAGRGRPPQEARREA